MRYFFMAMLLCCLSVSTVHAQSNLENPPGSSTMSGVSLVSGWKCTAGAVTVQFDSRAPEAAAYGTSRPDTQGVCGDQNNGFGLLFNFNRLGDGAHTVKVFDNGVQFGTATFTVHTLGQEFREGLSKTVSVPNFPSANQTTTLVWQEGQQNFVISGVTGGGQTGGTCTTKVFDGINTVWTVTNLCQGKQLLITVEAKSGFFLCGNVSVVQNGMQYDSINYDWVDNISGQHVCTSLLPGVTKNTILTFHGTLLLDLTAPFSFFINTQKLFDFP